MANKELQKKVQINVEKRRKQINKDVSIYSIFYVELEQLYKDYKYDLIRAANSLKNKELKDRIIKSLNSNKPPIKEIAKIYRDELAKEFNRATSLEKIDNNKYYHMKDANGYHFILIPKNFDKTNIYSVIQKASNRAKKNIDKILEAKNLDASNYVHSLTSAFISLAQVGHERSASAVELSVRTKALKELDLYKSKSRGLKSQLGKVAKSIENFETEEELIEGWNDLAVDLVKNTVKGKYTYKGISVLKFESARINMAKGSYQKDLVAIFEDFVLNNFHGFLRKRNSKSILDTMEDDIIAIFKDKPTKPLKKKSTYDKTIVNSKKVKPQKNIRLSISEAADIVLAKKLFELLDKEDTDLNEKIPYLNRRLHDKIRQNMGKGNAKQILNYRTGRFARSAKIESFFPSREKGAVNAVVKYMRYPYGTFEPGGRLHKPGRDPHVIFRRSIRQLLQEEKIVTLRRVKVELRG